MRHDIRIEGPAFRLRPVEYDDAGFMVALRTDPRLGHFLNPTSPNVGDQEAYLQGYFDRPGDYYFIIERKTTGEPEGMVAVYDIDLEEPGAAEWGRWILRHGSMAATESALLAYRVAFERLGLATVYCRTVLANEHAVSFQDSTGAPRHAVLKNHAQLASGPSDSVEHRVTREIWPDVETTLARSAEMVARLLDRR